MLIQKDTRRKLTEKFLRKGARLKLYIGTSELARQKTKQFLLIQAGSRKGPGGRLAPYERSLNPPGCGFLDQSLLNHFVNKYVHGSRRVLAQHAHQNQCGFLAQCEHLS